MWDGVPGSETALEKLICCITVDLITRDHKAKIADCRADTREHTVIVREEVLFLLQQNGVHLSAKKTSCCVHPRPPSLDG